MQLSTTNRKLGVRHFTDVYKVSVAVEFCLCLLERDRRPLILRISIQISYQFRRDKHKRLIIAVMNFRFLRL